jgi:MFS transporter, YNFM family, putative membrane transport protein
LDFRNVIMVEAESMTPAHVEHASAGSFLRNTLIGVTAFLTLVDLFATQAILPSLVERYHSSPGMVGLAVNASTLGMAVAAFLVALLSKRIDRRLGILVSLAMLSVPTVLLAFAPNLTAFALLRVAQGLCMSSAFTLTLAYLGEHISATDQASAFAAYITGNVASNLVGRLVAAAAAEYLGLSGNFFLFAGLNLAGALLVYFTVEHAPKMAVMSEPRRSPLASLRDHFNNGRLLAAFAIGFCILFAFIGTFTYVNFVLAAPPLGLGRMQLGYVYFVFLPSVFTTPQAGLVVGRLGAREGIWTGLAVAGVGLPLLLTGVLWLVLVGLVLVGVGTFLAQAIATGFVGRAARGDRGSASGIYLASYFAGGLAGAALLGQVFEHFGWPACVAGIAVALALAALLAGRLTLTRA